MHTIIRIRKSFFTIVIILSMVCIISCHATFPPAPATPVPRKELVGTWQWRYSDEYGAVPKPLKPSLLILHEDGRYEIHRPPNYFKALHSSNTPKPDTQKIYRSATCNVVVVETWGPAVGVGAGEDKLGRVFKREFYMTGLEMAIGGRTAPYFLYHYWSDPDVTPPEKWDKISKETKCPYCSDDVFDERNLIHPVSLSKIFEERP